MQYTHVEKETINRKEQSRYPLIYRLFTKKKGGETVYGYGGYTRLARAVAKAWIGVKGAWKSRMNEPLSIRPNWSTCVREKARKR